MLESSVWRQYHNHNSFREKIAEFTKLGIDDLIEDDKKLYAVLKAKLTKKELRLFAMDTADIEDQSMMDEFGYDSKTLDKAKFKLYKKLKQDKVRLSFRASANTDLEEF